MRVLVMNAGSSTLKWAVLASDSRATLASGTETWPSDELDQRGQLVADVVRAAGAFDVAGHRVVHGGTRFTDAVVVDQGVRAELERLAELDPLHMRGALAALDAVAALAPRTPQVAAFDTAFHAGMPEAAARYALPLEWTTRWQLRRFGFHGLSVRYSAERIRVLLGRAPHHLIVCHLGSGCSVTAVADGVSVDTTMGFTPLEGLVMATRSGSIDPGLLLHLLVHRGVRADELSDVLENRSGLLGMSGVSADLREVLAAADAGSAPARLTFDHFVHSVRRGVGAMAGVLGGGDAIVFTGGIGENSDRVRRGVAPALAGLELAAERSEPAEDRLVSAPGSRVAAAVIHAREDLAILDDVHRVLHGS